MGKRVIFTEEQMKYIQEHVPCSPILPRVNRIYNIFNCKGLLKEGLDERLVEGVFITYPLEEIVKHLCQYLNLTTDWETFRVDPKKYGGFLHVSDGENNEKFLEVVVLDDENTIHILKRCMRMCGYYAASNNRYEDSNCRYFVFEPRVRERKKDGSKNTINKVVKEHRYLYHLTLVDRLEKIMKNGLCPQTNMWDEYEYDKNRVPSSISRKNNKDTSEHSLKNNKGKHPSRIYFFLESPTFIEVTRMGQQMFGNENINNLILIVIDSEKLDVDFYYDPNTETGIFTEGNVPPSNIIRVVRLKPYDGKVETIYEK